MRIPHRCQGRLLAAISAPGAPDWIARLPAIGLLRRVWVQHFHLADGEVRWRTDREGIPPAALSISSPSRYSLVLPRVGGHP